MIKTRLMAAAFLLGRRRAEARAARQLADLADRFEEINCATNAELRALRNDITKLHALDDALETERGETRWLN